MYVNYDNILDKLKFKGLMANIKVSVVILRKIIVITLGPSFMDRFFYFTSDECLV